MNVSRLYRLYFLGYGLLHFAAGLAFWFIPSLTAVFLVTALSAEAAALVGFGSALAGLGFIGAAFVTEPKGQKTVILLSIAGNGLNFLAHLQNVREGFAQPWLALVAGAAVGLMVLTLIWMYRKIS